MLGTMQRQDFVLEFSREQIERDICYGILAGRNTGAEKSQDQLFAGWGPRKMGSVGVRPQGRGPAM